VWTGNIEDGPAASRPPRRAAGFHQVGLCGVLPPGNAC
jgi:hypothetical protein